MLIVMHFDKSIKEMNAEQSKAEKVWSKIMETS